VVGITAGSREVPGRNACDRRHAYCIIIIIIIIIKWIMKARLPYYGTNKCEPTEHFLTINQTS